jgi:hypothetical protein
VPSRHCGTPLNHFSILGVAVYEKSTAKKIILIFSDLKEDLQQGYLRDIDVIALNVTKLRSDDIDPREYLGRLEEWRGKVEKTGGEWCVINDLDGLNELLSEPTQADC